jgi:hypothetical protein
LGSFIAANVGEGHEYFRCSLIIQIVPYGQTKEIPRVTNHPQPPPTAFQLKPPNGKARAVIWSNIPVKQFVYRASPLGFYYLLSCAAGQPIEKNSSKDSPIYGNKKDGACDEENYKLN